MVSVVIPTFNRAVPVARAVSSVLFQTYKDYEIVVVDDGSTDHTRKTMQQFAGKIACVSLGANLGVSAARNAGIRATSAPFIAFLDSDDYWLPEKLAFQVDFFRNHPKALVCQTQEIWIRHGRKVNPQRKHLKPSGDIFNPSLRRCLVSPSAVMLKRSLLDEIGDFDESLPACEDYDMWLRIASRYPVPLLKRSLVVKTGGHSDQLSARFHGMDRFRVLSLAKLLWRHQLNAAQERALREELQRKCGIYAAGCLKRGRREEGEFYLALPERLAKGPVEDWPLHS